jgi:thiol-disulfide isomerase/thioredoxin
MIALILTFFVLILPFHVFAQSVAESSPPTPAEAYRRAVAAPGEFLRRQARSGTVITDEMSNIAQQEQVKLAKQYLSLFKPEAMAGDNLLDLGRLYLLARQPQNAEALAYAYFRKPPAGGDLSRARAVLLWSLVEQQKWGDATKVAKQLLDRIEYPQDVDKHIAALIRGLRPNDIQEAIEIAEKRFSKLLQSASRPNDTQIMLMAERAEELGEMYAETGDKAKAIKFLTSTIAQLEVGPQASEEFRFAARSLSASVRRLGIVGIKAPIIEGVEYIDMPPFTLESQRGKVVLIEFFAHSCAPCVADLPKLDALHEGYKAKGLEVVVVTSYRGYFGDRENITPSEELAALKSLKEERRTGIGFLIGPKTNFESYGVVNLPAIALIDRSGRVRVVKRYPKMEELEGMIMPLLAEPAASSNKINGSPGGSH